MVTYALDSSAVLRFIDKEAGFEQVRSILEEVFSEKSRVLICAVHWGEIAGNLHRKKGIDVLQQAMSWLLQIGIELVPVSPERAVRAAIFKNDLRIPYADAFGVELAESIPCTFVTADYDLKPAAKQVEIFFLPKK